MPHPNSQSQSPIPFTNSPARAIDQPTVHAIMAKRVVTVTMDDSLARVRDLFNEFHFHHLLVTQDHRLVGIISDRDMLKAVSPYVGTLSEMDRDRATLNKRVHQIMGRKLITAGTDMTVEAAAHLLLENRVSCLPIVTKDGRIEGIVTWRDLLRQYLLQKTSV